MQRAQRGPGPVCLRSTDALAMDRTLGAGHGTGAACRMPGWHGVLQAADCRHRLRCAAWRPPVRGAPCGPDADAGTGGEGAARGLRLRCTDPGCRHAAPPLHRRPRGGWRHARARGAGGASGQAGLRLPEEGEGAGGHRASGQSGAGLGHEGRLAPSADARWRGACAGRGRGHGRLHVADTASPSAQPPHAHPVQLGGHAPAHARGDRGQWPAHPSGYYRHAGAAPLLSTHTGWSIADRQSQRHQRTRCARQALRADAAGRHGAQVSGPA